MNIFRFSFFRFLLPVVFPFSFPPVRKRVSEPIYHYFWLSIMASSPPTDYAHVDRSGRFPIRQHRWPPFLVFHPIVSPSLSRSIANLTSRMRQDGVRRLFRTEWFIKIRHRNQLRPRREITAISHGSVLSSHADHRFLELARF